jgi:acetoacetate decarboxylase
VSLAGWTLPQSDTGRAAILTPPPWHYSGEIISVDFVADEGRVAPLLPPGMEPAGDGSCSFVFADWCSASDHDERVRDDPARGQYKEAYVILYGTFEGKPVGRVAYIWVDSDLSLVRGLIQGFPKKMGTIAMTRPVELGQGGVRKEPGSRFSAHVSSLGRRLCTLSVTLDDQRDKPFPRGIATPLLHTRLWPSIDGEEPAVHELSRVTIKGFECGQIFSGPATLELGASEFEELEALAPVSIEGGSVHSLAFSVTGGTTLPSERPRAGYSGSQRGRP